MVGHEDQPALVAQGVEAVGVDAHHAGQLRRGPEEAVGE
jgi:hypothetical protein